jgi:N-methylhydantoinase A/oxoprolinase/acetone carboxylase beta subunit
MEGDFAFMPTAEEERIYALLRKNPLTQEQLTAHLGLLSPSLLNLGGLEESGLVQRCGLTPTDLLHIEGEFRRWDSKPAFIMLEKLSDFLHKPLQQITRELREMITVQLSEELMKSAVFPDFSDEELEQSRVYKHITRDLLHENGQRHALKAAIRHPIIGIGAPAPFFLPKSCELLGAEILIPDNADVANAIGAITSSIFLRNSLTIQPADGGGYRVIGVTGAPLFTTLENAEQWVLHYLQESLRENAKKAGTLEETVDVDIDDSLSTLSDGSTLFLERIITASLKGTPDQVNPLT